MEKPADLADALADMLGIYGTAGDGDHSIDCKCRICWVWEMEQRIKQSVLNYNLSHELKNLKVKEQTKRKITEEDLNYEALYRFLRDRPDLRSSYGRKERYSWQELRELLEKFGIVKPDKIIEIMGEMGLVQWYLNESGTFFLVEVVDC